MTISTIELDFAALWDAALGYPQFVAESGEHRELWEGIYRLARIPQWALDEVRPYSGRRHLLVLAEDWCGDAFNTIPVLARLTDLSGHIDLKVLRRDDNPEVMDRYLTSGSRSIPIVIVLDEEFREIGHWGPRPAELQAWFLANRELPKQERYPLIRRWYARDRGESVLREVLGLVTRHS